MKLIVGLGNPGKEYENTRHNIGFMSVDKIIHEKNLTEKEKFNGKYYEYNINNEKIIILKPQNYINLSGKVINKFVNYFKIDINDILIIHDDLDLPVGKIKLRMSGGSGGHNGLKDIENCLKTKNYKRVKVGISNNKNIDTKDYVLGRFNSEDKKIIDNSINTISNIINDFPYLTFENLMNKYN